MGEEIRPLAGFGDSMGFNPIDVLVQDALGEGHVDQFADYIDQLLTRLRTRPLLLPARLHRGAGPRCMLFLAHGWGSSCAPRRAMPLLLRRGARP
jgi:hypothetical protein